MTSKEVFFTRIRFPAPGFAVSGRLGQRESAAPEQTVEISAGLKHRQLER